MPDYDTPYERERERIVRAMLPKGTGTAVDIGCNDGRFTALLPDAGYWPVLGYDSDERVVGVARRTLPAIDFRAAQDDFSVKERALTVTLELLEHIPPAAQLGFLRSIRGATAPGGRLLLSTPGRYSLLATAERLAHFRQHRLEPYTWWDPTHVSVLSYARLLRLLRAADFSIEHRVGFCFAPPRWVKPRASHGVLARGGFDILIVARTGCRRGVAL